MKKQSLFLLFFVLILYGCSHNHDVEEQPEIEREPATKKTSMAEISPIRSDDAYIEIIDWFDDERVFYLSEHAGNSIIYIHHLFSGETEHFFSSDDTIVEVDIHLNKKKVAISTLDEQNFTSYYIVNEVGEVIFTAHDIQGDVAFFWNPYDDNQVIVVTYLPNWDFEIHHLLIEEGKLELLPLEQTYVQWIDEETIAYLNWNTNEPSFYAPLVFYNLSTKEKEQFLNEVITFFSLYDKRFVTLSVPSIYELETQYSFFRDKEKMNEMFVPILDTYSEQWWVPYFDYNEKESLFIFFRPKYSGTFVDYNEPYELVSFHVETGKEEILLELNKHFPIKLSPNGKYLLYGAELQSLIDLAEAKNYTLIQRS